MQLDHEEELAANAWNVPLDAGLEVLCNIKRAELTAFLSPWENFFGSTTARVHWPKSEGRKLVDFDLGGGAQISSKKKTAGSRTRQCASLPEGEAENDALRKMCYIRQ